jgi:hypothetical protein
LHEGEHCVATRAALAHQRVVTKLLLIICDCRISAIDSLQKRHTLGDNARWEIFIRGGGEYCPIVTSGGLPSISAQRKSCMQNGLCGKRPQGLGFRQVPALTGALFQTNFTAARWLPAPDKFRSNM